MQAVLTDSGDGKRPSLNALAVIKHLIVVLTFCNIIDIRYVCTRGFIIASLSWQTITSFDTTEKLLCAGRQGRSDGKLTPCS